MKKFIINVNGNQYEVEVEEVIDGAQVSPIQRPTPVSKPAPQAAPAPQPKPQEKKEVAVAAGNEVIEAPMPGTIFSIDVSEGDIVSSGQVLVILEAMKMENEILAPRDGKIVSVNTTKGASVNTGDKLIVIE